jgi:plastocyanin
MKKDTRDRLVLPILLPVGILAAIVLAMVLFSRILLSVTPDAATAVALIVGFSVLGAAGLIASRKRISSAAGLGSLLGIVGGIALLAGGIALAVAPPEAEHAGAGTQAFAATITAPPGAAAKGFSTSKLRFPAGAPVDLKFDNQDPNVQHNVAIFSTDPTKDPSAQALFTGALETGPTTTTYKIKALQAGTYYFHCDVHPTTMHGTLTVAGSAPSGPAPSASPASGGSAPAGAAAPGGAVSIVAQGLAFNTDTITLSADTPTTLSWDNEDAGVPHNLTIYQDSSLPADTSAKKLFTFEPAPGVLKKDFTIPGLPAGTYVFQCDVHPTMDGTVTVK